MSVVALDFDGVLHDWQHPSPGRRMGPPISGALEGVRGLISQGHEVVVFSVRGSDEKRKHVEDWLSYFGFPEMRVTNVKEAFDLIVDDRAIRFTGWPIQT